MTKRIFLWLNTIISTVYLTGHLFDFFVVMSNWRAGTVELLTSYRTFFIHADPGHFFRIVVPVSVVLSVISFFAYWKSDKQIKIMLSVHLVLTLGAFLFTMFYFLPINKYLFWNKEISLDPTLTMELVNKWVFGEHLRVVFGFVALIVSTMALHLSYTKLTHNNE
ncbi:MAG: DUF1772 domain-containing protein [Saprospiraceae bacterium]|nr:DUF1772 domain-containing protein [Saprospiraceae bacterium]